MLFSIPILFSEAIHPIFYLQGRNNLSIQALLNFISKIIFLGFIVFFVMDSNDTYKVNFVFGFSLIVPYLFFGLEFISRIK